jgi:uncharacterized protein YjaG (DUF416 family)
MVVTDGKVDLDSGVDKFEDVIANVDEGRLEGCYR